MVWPVVQQYALIENALARRARALPSDRQRDEIAALWARFNAVAGAQPRGGVPAATQRSGHRHAGAAQPAARLSLQPVARQPVDRQPGVGAPDLLGRAGARGRRPARALALPPRGAAFVERGHADRPAPTWSAWPAMGVLGRAAAAPPRPAAARAPPGRGLLLLPRRRAGAAARARARPRRHADAQRRHGVRRRAVQPLRPAVPARPGRPAARRARRAGPADHGVGHALQARPRRLVGHATGRAAARRSWPTWQPRRSRPPRSCPSSTSHRLRHRRRPWRPSP